MNNMLVFLVLVAVGIGGVVFFSNQSASPATNNNLSQIPSLSPTNSTPLEVTSAPSLAATPTKDPTASVEATVSTAVIKTSKGDITLTLYPNEAPNTVKNFVNKAKSGFYNNLTFHRVEDWVIQGGDPKGNGTGGGNMPTELNSKPFVVGALGVARGQDIKISNDAQFFITKKDSQFLNNQYTNFGQVTAGMDVVNNIAIGDKILGITVK